VERWLTELGVGWVLSLNGGTSAGEELHRRARSWIRALDQITQTICSMRPLFPDPDRGSLDLLHSVFLFDEEEHVSERCIPYQYHLVLFIQETLLKILTFVDGVVVVAWDPDRIGEFLSMDPIMLPPYAKLYNQLAVHDALSEASDKILTMFDSPTSVEAQRIDNDMAILLSAYKSKVGKAIRSTMEKIRVMLAGVGDDSSSSLNPQGSSDIHKITRSVMTYIRFLLSNYPSVDAVIRAKYVPHIEIERPLDSMIMEMVSFLQEKLANISESFPDQGLRFLFLLNNSYHIQQRFHSHYYLPEPIVLLADDISHKIKGYMERYLQVSWALLLSCLLNPTSHCLGKNSSSLYKFESEFQKIYTSQKEWKVPDPELRRRLREVITNKIIPGYIEYIEDNKVTHPKISPQELEVMLQELFEG